MTAEYDGAAIGFDQVPRNMVGEPTERQTQKPQTQYLSFNIGRWVNADAEEFADLSAYMHRLGSANYEPAQHDELTSGHDKYPITKITNPEDVHVMSIYAADARELLMRAFAHSDGRFRHPKKVKQKVRNMCGRYDKEMKKRNQNTQDEITYHLQSPEANPNRLPLDPRDLGHVALRMTSGIFDTKHGLQGFGDGRKFGITFSPEANRFLNEERAVSLQFIIDKLGISHIDSDLEDRILGKEHHATLIKKGGKDPYSLSYPTDELGDTIPVPSAFVTALDPNMRCIDGNSQRAA